MTQSLEAYLILSILLFGIGVFGFLAKRNAIAMLMSIEIMLNAVNLAIIAFGAFTPELAVHASTIALFVIAVAAGEATVGPRHRHRHLPQPSDAARRRVLVDAGVGDRPWGSSTRREQSTRQPMPRATTQLLILLVLALPLAGFLLTGVLGRRMGGRPWIIAVVGHPRGHGPGHGPRLPVAQRRLRRVRRRVHALHLDPGRRARRRRRLPRRQPHRARAHRGDLDRLARPHLLDRVHGPRPGQVALLRLPQPVHVLDAPAGADRQLPRAVRGVGAGGPVSSYLLIGFWFTKRAPALASKKAFLVNRVADHGFLIGIIGIWLLTGTMNVPGVVRGWPFLDADLLGRGDIVALLLFVGAAGKSAQFPFHVWLPDAMEGPTPVSALIHAATMVNAGRLLRGPHLADLRGLARGSSSSSPPSAPSPRCSPPRSR